MDQIVTRITVLFEGPFWVGIYERVCCRQYAACKITFGAEPKDSDVLDFLEKKWKTLRFSPTVQTEKAERNARNPKRMQRLVHRTLQTAGIGTKAQQALKRQQEEHLQMRKNRARQRRAADKERVFQIRQEKRREKHRGH